MFFAMVVVVVVIFGEFFLGLDASLLLFSLIPERESKQFITNTFTQIFGSWCANGLVIENLSEQEEPDPTPRGNSCSLDTSKQLFFQQRQVACLCAKRNFIPKDFVVIGRTSEKNPPAQNSCCWVSHPSWFEQDGSSMLGTNHPSPPLRELHSRSVCVVSTEQHRPIPFQTVGTGHPPFITSVLAHGSEPNTIPETRDRAADCRSFFPNYRSVILEGLQ